EVTRVWWPGVGQQFVQPPAHFTQRAWYGGRQVGSPDLTGPVNLGQGHALGVIPLGKGERQRRPAVPDRRSWRRCAEVLLAVQVAERHVGQASENGRRRVADTSDTDVPF